MENLESINTTKQITTQFELLECNLNSDIRLKEFLDLISIKFKEKSGIDQESLDLDLNLKIENDRVLIRSQVVKKDEEEDSKYFKVQKLIHSFFNLKGKESLLNYFPHSPELINKENKPIELNLDNFKNKLVLIFSPHQDDEVLGAAALIYNLVKSGINFKVIYMTSGKGGGNSEVRKLEAISGIKVLGGNESNCIFENFPFYLDENREVTINDLNYFDNVINKYENVGSIFICADIFDPNLSHRKCYDIILNYFYYKENKESQKTIKQIYKEIFNYKEIKIYFYYSVWYWPKENEINNILFYDVNVYKKKVHSMLEHLSQIANNHMGLDDRPFFERSTHRDKWFGSKYGIGTEKDKNAYCEVYYCVN